MNTAYKSKKEQYEDMLRRTNLSDKHVLCAYMYGSRVYGNYKKDSDYDYIVVISRDYSLDKATPKSFDTEAGMQFSDNLINVNLYFIDEYRKRITDHEPSALECVFLPEEFILKSCPIPEQDYFDDVLDLGKLRHAFSAKSSNSWVKAKKKLTVPDSYNDLVGKKSLWHSLRLLDFGTQIANYKRIIDYASCNYFYDEVMYCKEWVEMFEKYKKTYNSMCTEFKKVAPKNLE